jgi:hypothetical protein
VGRRREAILPKTRRLPAVRLRLEGLSGGMLTWRQGGRGPMSTLSTTEMQLLVVTGAYAVALVVVVYLTRAGRRRVAGAFAGGLSAAFAIAATPIHLLTWRVVRRHGMRGLAICAGLAGLVGPPRDYAYAAAFPNWIVFSPGMTPVLAVAITYVLWIAVGYGVMRLVAGPADADALRKHRATLIHT